MHVRGLCYSYSHTSLPKGAYCLHKERSSAVSGFGFFPGTNLAVTNAKKKKEQAKIPRFKNKQMGKL